MAVSGLPVELADDAHVNWSKTVPAASVLYAKDRKKIMNATGVSCAVRPRRGEFQLSMAGPQTGHKKAYKMAKAKIDLNLTMKAAKAKVEPAPKQGKKEVSNVKKHHVKTVHHDSQERRRIEIQHQKQMREVQMQMHRRAMQQQYQQMSAQQQMQQSVHAANANASANDDDYVDAKCGDGNADSGAADAARRTTITDIIECNMFRRRGAQPFVGHRGGVSC